MENNSVCNHTSDNRVITLQTELDDTKSYYQLIIKIRTSGEKKNTKVWKEKIFIKSFYTLSIVIETKVVTGWFKLQLSEKWLFDLNYNFESDWLIELSDNNTKRYSWLALSRNKKIIRKPFSR